MRGAVRTREKCPVCGGKFTLQVMGRSMGLFCANGHQTVPQSFYVDGRSIHRPYRRGDTPPPSVGILVADEKKRPFRHYGDAVRIHEMILADYDKDPPSFRAEKWSNLGREELTVKAKWRIYQQEIDREKKANASGISRAFRLHIIPCPIGDTTFGEISVLDVTAKHLKDLRYMLAEAGNKQGSVNTYMRHLRGFFTWLKYIDMSYQDRDIPRFPKMVRVHTRKPWVDSETQEMILAEMPKHCHLFLRVGFETGMRISELRALKVGDLLPPNIIFLQEAVKSSGEEGETKEGKTHDYIVSEELFAELKAAAKGRLDTAYLLVNKWGRKFTREWISRTWKKAADRLGIPGVTPKIGIRHSLASKMRQDGMRRVNEDIRSRLTHSSIATTDEYYIQAARDKVVPIRREG